MKDGEGKDFGIMDNREFNRVTSILKSAYPRLEYLNDPASTDVLYNMLNRFEYQDVWQGIKNLIEMERYAPSIAVVRQYVEEAEKNRKQALYAMTDKEREDNTVKCPKCNDAGFLWVTYADGTETARICTCETAKKENPWAFLDEKELEAKNDELRKRGQNPPRGKPGHPTEWWIKECGEIVSISPGRRLPARKMER